MKKIVAALLLFVSPFAAYASPIEHELCCIEERPSHYAFDFDHAAPGAGPFQVALTAARAET